MQQNSQNSSSNKVTAIILAIVIVTSFILFFYFKGKGKIDNSSLLEQTDTKETLEAKATNERIIKILQQVSILNIDNTIFQSKIYKSLVDHTVEVPEQNIGRENPFAPVGGIPPAPVISAVKRN